MHFTPAPNYQVQAVSLLLFERGKFLLIRRANMPFKNWLSFPGGKVEQGESAKQAAARELWEETGLQAQYFKHLVTLDLAKEGEAKTTYFLSVYHGQHVSGQARAADDAAALFYLSLAEMQQQKDCIIPSVLEVACYFERLNRAFSAKVDTGFA